MARSMTDRPTLREPLTDALTGYLPGDPTEAADLRRLRALLAGGDVWRRSVPVHVTGSAVIVHPASRRVLLRWHPHHRAWLQVGGHADPGETDPLAIALREGAEETGLEDLVPWPDGAIVHLAVVPVGARADEPAHEHADIRFVLATGSPDAIRPEHAEAELRWLPVEEAIAATAQPNLRETLDRVRRLLDGHASGR
jgi:8-oxo-dGTP pyrophosphatase MutT (NUDIX family)